MCTSGCHLGKCKGELQGCKNEQFIWTEKFVYLLMQRWQEGPNWIGNRMLDRFHERHHLFASNPKLLLRHNSSERQVASQSKLKTWRAHRGRMIKWWLVSFFHSLQFYPVHERQEQQKAFPPCRCCALWDNNHNLWFQCKVQPLSRYLFSLGNHHWVG